MFSTWIVHLRFKGHLLWALSIHLPFAYISQIPPQGDMQRIRGYFTESLSLLPFPDNKVVIISCRAHPRERVLGDLERSCRSVTMFAAVLGTVSSTAACQHPAQLWVGFIGEPGGSEVMCRPVPANPLGRPTSSLHFKGTNPMGRGCKHCPKDKLHRHLRRKHTANLSGLLFP